MSAINVILGGSGLIGRALERQLRARGEETVVFDLKSGFDLRTTEPRTFPASTYYWFLAWDVGGAKYIMDPSAQIDILKSNLRLCDRVFTWLQERKAEFTFVSTQMVGYSNSYGISKAVGEHWTKTLSHGRICRLWNVYGAEEPSRRSHIIPDLVAQAAAGKVRLLTSGEERRQFIIDDDCADALITQREIAQPHADITSGQWVSIRDLARIVCELGNTELAWEEPAGYESLVEPMRPLRDWKPKIGLRDGLEKVISRMREQGWS